MYCNITEIILFIRLTMCIHDSFFYRRMIYALRRRLHCHEFCFSNQQKLLSHQKDLGASNAVIETSVSVQSKFSYESHYSEQLKTSPNHADKPKPKRNILPLNKKPELEIDEANRILTLPQGTAVDRDHVEISAPFNPEIKLMW